MTERYQCSDCGHVIRLRECEISDDLEMECEECGSYGTISEV